MSTFNARGIVLKETMVGEADKIVTLLLKDIGKLSVSAKGARKAKSKFLAGTQLFTYSDFIIFNGGKFHSITQIDVIENFYDIRKDFEKLCYGNYFLELCDKTILPNQPCNEMLLMLLKALAALTKSKVQPKLVAGVFDFKFLQLNGYTPETKNCVICGNITTGYYWGSQGLVCPNCQGKAERLTRVSSRTVDALKYILDQEATDLYKFSVDTRILDELAKVSCLLIDSHFEVYLKSKELIQDM